MPYRTSADAADATVSVLLVTSRDTGRWVLPKGNPVKGLSLYESAAQEAEEEAGARGTASPVSVGSYRYQKIRRNGASDMLDVDVFPILVTEEMDAWEEQHERERKWHSLAEAAEAVNEADLQVLIRNFRASKIVFPAKEDLDPVHNRNWMFRRIAIPATVVAGFYFLTRLF